MPFELRLPGRLKGIGWKVKIRDKERLEPPHVTILRFTRSWRIGLRNGRFLETGDSWNDIDPEVRSLVEAAREELVAQWNRMYPENPVGETDDD